MMEKTKQNTMTACASQCLHFKILFIWGVKKKAHPRSEKVNVEEEMVCLSYCDFYRLIYTVKFNSRVCLMNVF